MSYGMHEICQAWYKKLAVIAYLIQTTKCIKHVNKNGCSCVIDKIRLNFQPSINCFSI